MEIPPLTSTEGAYWYLIGLIALLAVLLGLYVAAAIRGYLPEPSGLLWLAAGPMLLPVATAPGRSPEGRTN